MADESKRLAELYSAMNDGELESIAKDPSSLTAVAQSALATELRRRNLTQETPPVPRGYDEPESRSLTGPGTEDSSLRSE